MYSLGKPSEQLTGTDISAIPAQEVNFCFNDYMLSLCSFM